MKTKKLLLLIILALIPTLGYNQSINVKSFRPLPNDLSARDFPEYDQNGHLCAILKVVTPHTGFSWESDRLGIVETERRTGEYWLYLPHGAQRINIFHDQLGILRNYAYPEPIQSGMVYEMVLTTDDIEIVVREREVELQWLIIESEPNGADVHINDQPVGKTPYWGEMEVGTYNWRVSHNLYKPNAGVVTLMPGEENKEELNVQLTPDYGTITIRSSPESGADISINGFNTGRRTPATFEQIQSGEVRITLSMADYETTTRLVELEAGTQLPVEITMRPTFAPVTIRTDPSADIYINNQRRGNRQWQGRLGAGNYTFEARLQNHRPHTERRQVTAGQPFELTLNPQPITGQLRITGQPIGSTIRIAGQNRGTIPTTLRNLLIGDYDVEISHPNHATVKERVTVKENETTELNVNLPSGMEVTISSEPAGAQLFIGGEHKGRTPWTGVLSFGRHNLRLVNNTRTVDESIFIRQLGESRWLFDVSEGKRVTITSFPSGADIYIDNIFVGRTPHEKLFKYGDYKVSLNLIEREGKSERITISETGPDAFNYSLPSLKKEVMINSRPNGADVFIDGANMGKTPFKSNLLPTTYEIEIVKKGFLNQKRRLKLSNKPISKNYTLREKFSMGFLLGGGAEKQIYDVDGEPILNPDGTIMSINLILFDIYLQFYRVMFGFNPVNINQGQLLGNNFYFGYRFFKPFEYVLHYGIGFFSFDPSISKEKDLHFKNSLREPFHNAGLTITLYKGNQTKLLLKNDLWWFEKNSTPLLSLGLGVGILL